MGAELEDASESVLAATVARRHPVALEEIFRRHAGAVYAIARRLSDDPHEAAGVVHDVFVGFWTEPEFDPGTDTLRMVLLARTYRVAAGRRVSGWSARSSLTRHDCRAETHVDAAVELACLPGSSYRDIAMFLGQTEATVRADIRAGLGQIRSSGWPWANPAW